MPNHTLYNFIEIRLRHGFPPVYLLHIVRVPFPKNTSGLFLKVHRYCLDVYLGPYQIFKIELFAKIVNSRRLNYFCKKPHRRCLVGSLICLFTILYRNIFLCCYFLNIFAPVNTILHPLSIFKALQPVYEN